MRRENPRPREKRGAQEREENLKKWRMRLVQFQHIIINYFIIVIPLFFSFSEWLIFPIFRKSPLEKGLVLPSTHEGARDSACKNKKKMSRQAPNQGERLRRIGGSPSLEKKNEHKVFFN